MAQLAEETVMAAADPTAAGVPHEPAARGTTLLRWGLPVLESSITLIADNHLYYRGNDAVALARSRSVAEVASLIARTVDRLRPKTAA